MKKDVSRWQEEFVENTIFRMEESLRMITRCFESLREDELWTRPNDSSNSIGNLVLHLKGNITQYVMASVGGEDDMRERDLEFSTRSGYDKAALLDLLKETVSRACTCISRCDEAEFLRMRTVQGFRFSGLGSVLHAVEHLSYHTGQIAFWTKILKDEDLGFYRGKDLNMKNE